jgi:hypothetical protein
MLCLALTKARQRRGRADENTGFYSKNYEYSIK